MPTFGSLFAGIGGIDLGLERAGWECRWQVEWDGWCQHNLGHHWPDVPRMGDITGVDWASVESVDLIAGGFPCQPVSVAGRRRGTSDDRWLWPEFARAIRALRPQLVLVENVPGLLRPWLDRDGCGLWHEAPIEEVLADLATLGYVGEYESIPAEAVGAPHERDRVWLVADAGRRSVRTHGGHRPAHGAGRTVEGAEDQRQWRGDTARSGGQDAGTMADAEGNGRGEGRSGGPVGDRSGKAQRAHGPEMADAEGNGSPGPREPLISRDPAALGAWKAAQLVDGGWWSSEPDVGRVAHGVPARVDRLRALGNAVVPQIPEWIGRRLLEVMENVA